MLLADVGIDLNNTQYLVAYLVVEKDNTETWTWFMMLLSKDLGIHNPGKFTMISDRKKGLEKPLGDVFPGVEIILCVGHLHSKFKKEHSGLLLKQMLWACARAFIDAEFKQRMSELMKDEV